MTTCPSCTATYNDHVAVCPHDGARLRSADGLKPGSIIRKKYEVIDEIGRGGMGVVYRVRHLIWHEEKALKMLNTGGANQHRGGTDLLTEALVMRQFQHPHIVRVEDADFAEDDQPFVVMEYVNGESLRRRLSKERALAPDFALKIGAQTCSALAAAHQKGIIHRDIKPQNLLLTRDQFGGESVKVIDFGIAKVREDAGLGFLGAQTGTTGHFVCTPAYASPEQAEGMRGSDLDGRSDVYSLGLVLYEMLTGCQPFVSDNAQALLVQRLRAEPLALERARPELTFSPVLCRLVMKAIERERDRRWSSAEELEHEIARLLNGARPARRIPRLAYGSFGLAVGLTMAAWFATHDDRKHPLATDQHDPADKTLKPKPAQIPPSSASNEIPAHPEPHAKPAVAIRPSPAARQREPSFETKPMSALPYTGPTEGRIVWTGSLDSGQEIDLAAGDSAGAVSGTLPGVPVTLEVHPAGIQVVTPPGAENQWRHLVVRADAKRQVVIVVKWAVILP